MKAMSRREFVKSTSTAAAATTFGVFPNPFSDQGVTYDKLPRWKGFNLLDFFTSNPKPSYPRLKTEEVHLKWMADWGFNFIRLPMAYPYFLRFDRSEPITTDRMEKFHRKRVREMDQIIEWADKYGIHVSLNLHRAPGFCINSGFVEPYNLWYSEQALDDFCAQWAFWAKRYRRYSPSQISFDLLNEPCLREDMNDQYSERKAVPGPVYRNLIMRASRAIKNENPKALIIADGNNIGADVITEATDLEVAQSCRGYTPHIISHYKAEWAFKDFSQLPQPEWPITHQNTVYDRVFLEQCYEPWIALTRQGIGVHCGECGCYKETPHDVFLAWFGDVLSIFKENQIGFALWNFIGDFGILDSRRKDVTYKTWNGHQLDEKLLKLLADL
ncbi:MAG: cellulase family glycosylhydrolase [Bacteroidota bacterium]